MNFEDTMKLALSLADTGESDLRLLQKLVIERKDLAGDVAELGAWQCGSTIAMARVTDKKIYSFDLFGGLPYGNQGAFDKFGHTDFDAINRYTCRFPNIKLVRGLHEDTVPVFPPQDFAMIYMDSDFYDSHVVGLSNFWPMLVSGGIVVFHDYSFESVRNAIKDVIPPEECSFLGQLEGSLMGAAIKK